MNKFLRTNFNHVRLYANINCHPKNIFNFSNVRKGFFDSVDLMNSVDSEIEREKKYKPIKLYISDSEVLKFYKNYLQESSDVSKSHYEILLNSKIEKLGTMSTLQENRETISKSIGLDMMEIKTELEEVIKIMSSKISVSKESDLQLLSQYYFKTGGKMIRPYLFLSFSKYIYECEFGEKSDYFNSTIHQNYVLPFTAAYEYMYNLSFLNNDTITDSDNTYKLLGLKDVNFIPQFIIGRAANLVADLNISNLNDLYSNVAHHLIIREQNNLWEKDLGDFDSSLKDYMLKTFNDDALLTASGLRGLAIILKLDDVKQRKFFDLGLHIGIVFKMVDDVLYFIYDSNDINRNKSSLKDPNKDMINPSILFEICDEKKNAQSSAMLEMAKRNFAQDGDINNATKILQKGTGIIKTQNLAYDHLTECYKILNDQYFKNSSSKDKIYQFLNFLMNRKN